MLRTSIAFRIFAALLFARLQAPASTPAEDAKALAIHVTLPRVPDEARAKHLSGSGTILVHVRADGTVSKAEVVQSSGHKILDNAALTAFAQWQFRPGTRNEIKIPFTFTGNYGKRKDI